MSIYDSFASGNLIFIESLVWYFQATNINKRCNTIRSTLTSAHHHNTELFRTNLLCLIVMQVPQTLLTLTQQLNQLFHTPVRE